MAKKKTGLQNAQVKALLLLLALWDMEGIENKIKKSELNKRLGRKKQNAEDYDKAYQQLDKDGAIAIVTNKRSASVSLTEKGLKKLSEGLSSPDFAFGSQIGAKTANALLKWMRSTETPENGATASNEIESYEEFKKVALEVYDKLNRNQKLNDLVPIYEIRRNMGYRVNRDKFDEWLLEMQANDILQLQGGSLPDSDSTKIKDSIETELSGLRCYAKRLIS